MPANGGPPEPWKSFFDALDGVIKEPIALHCIGGFAVIYGYGVARTTNDCDFAVVVGNSWLKEVSELGGRGSELHTRHRVYLDPVTVVTLPESYEDRLLPLFPGTWQRVTLFALEAHDLALAKLERNFSRDQNDVKLLAQAGRLDPRVLKERYETELRPNFLSREGLHDITLREWLASYFPEQ